MKQNIYDHPRFFEGYTNLRKNGLGLNEALEQPAIKSIVPNLEGLKVLDLGCGTGHFAKFCVDNGAKKVVGVDISRKMLQLAKEERSHPKIEYINCAIEDLDLPQGNFDLIVSSYVFHYVKDYSSLVLQLNRLLKHNGLLIYSIEHPICTARNPMEGWIKDEKGNKLYWPVDHYSDEGKRQNHWFVEGVIKYHRSLSTLINGLIDGGYSIERVIEPGVVPEATKDRPDLINENRRPPVFIIKSKKVRGL